MHNVGLINHTPQLTHAGTQDVSKINGWSPSFFFIARFSDWVAGAAARD